MDQNNSPSLIILLIFLESYNKDVSGLKQLVPMSKVRIQIKHIKGMAHTIINEWIFSHIHGFHVNFSYFMGKNWLVCTGIKQI